MRASFAYAVSRFCTPLTGLLFLCALILTTVTGPFGTFDGMTLWWRGLYWFIMLVGVFVLGCMALAIVLGVWGGRRRLVNALLCALVMTLLFSPYALVLQWTFCAISAMRPFGAGTTVIYVFLLSVIVFVLRAQLVDDAAGLRDRAAAADPSTKAKTPVPRLVRRLSVEGAPDIVRLEAQDHLIEVVTTAGREKLRMRFGDAIDEMEPVDGFCTHRSHWVAAAAVVAAERGKPGTMYLRLINGERVPVSRTYRPDVERRGYLPR